MILDDDENRTRMVDWARLKAPGSMSQEAGALAKEVATELPKEVEFLGLKEGDEPEGAFGAAYTPDRIWLIWLEPSAPEVTIRSHRLAGEEVTSEVRLGRMTGARSAMIGPLRERRWTFIGRDWRLGITSYAGWPEEERDVADNFASKLAEDLGWSSAQGSRG